MLITNDQDMSQSPLAIDPSMDTLSIFIEFVKRYCSTLDSSLKKDCILLYYGIQATGSTLNKIGEIYNVTRERVRQVRSEHVYRLKKIFNDPESTMIQQYPMVLQRIYALRDKFLEHAIIRIELAKKILESEGVNFTDDRRKHLDLFLEIFDITTNNMFLTKMYFTRPARLYKAYRKKYSTIRQFFKKNILPSNIDILSKETKIPISILRDILSSMPDIEKTDIDCYQMVASELAVTDIAYRVLAQTGASIHYSELASIVSRLRGANIEELRLCVDGRFKPIGNSGHWVVKETNIDTDTISARIEKALIFYGKPCSMLQLHKHLKQTIPGITLDSVIGIVTVYNKKKFLRLQDHKIILVSWKKKYEDSILIRKVGRSKINATSALVELMGTEARKAFPVIKKLVTLTGLTERSCISKFYSSPLLKKYQTGPDGKNTYILKDNYIDYLPKRMQVRIKIKDAIKNLFKKENTNVLKRRYIVESVLEEHGVSIPYIYQILRNDKQYKIDVRSILDSQVTFINEKSCE